MFIALFLPPLHLPLLLNMQRPQDEIKINHMFIVRLCLIPSGSYVILPLQ